LIVSFDDQELGVDQTGGQPEPCRWDPAINSCDLVSEQMKPRVIDLNSAVQRALNFLRQHNGEQNNAA
jgi:hypothetical protein